MERRGEGEERVFGAFGGGGFVELLGEGDLGGVGELMGVEEVGGGGEHAVRLVEGDGVGVERFLLRCPPAYPPPSSSSPSPAAFRMLCFGGDEGDNGHGFSKKSSDSCSSTSYSSSSSKKKTEGRRGTSTKATAARARARARATTATAPKKPRKEQPQGQQPPCSQRRASKGRKEKLGERISALQQLVSPFGKSDTASVLHEALGYIRFLHDQVQGGVDGGGGAELRPDLRSRGLCLVPVACTAHVEASNGADFWSPAMGGGGDHRQPAVSKH